MEILIVALISMSVSYCCRYNGIIVLQSVTQSVSSKLGDESIFCLSMSKVSENFWKRP